MNTEHIHWPHERSRRVFAFRPLNGWAPVPANEPARAALALAITLWLERLEMFGEGGGACPP